MPSAGLLVQLRSAGRSRKWLGMPAAVIVRTAAFNTAKQAAMAFAKGAKSIPQSGIASSFTGPVNLHADPDVVAEALLA